MRAKARGTSCTHHDGAERGARIAAQRLLVDDDRSREIVQRVRIRLAATRKKHLHERRERLVDEPLRLRGDRVEHQRALPAARDAGEDGDLPTGNVERDVLEIVLARAAHFDVAERRAHARFITEPLVEREVDVLRGEALGALDLDGRVHAAVDAVELVDEEVGVAHRQLIEELALGLRLDAVDLEHAVREHRREQLVGAERWMAGSFRSSSPVSSLDTTRLPASGSVVSKRFGSDVEIPRRQRARLMPLQEVSHGR
jgi:hypothetical protein